MTAWFLDPDALAKVADGKRERWPKGVKPAPDTSEVKELAWHLWKSSGRRALLHLCVISAVYFAFSFGVDAVANETYSYGFELLLQALFLPMMLAVAGPMRAEILGNRLENREVLGMIFGRYASVAITTWISGFVLTIAFAMLIIPGLLLLPFVVRAPYEAAAGASPWQAIRRSAEAARMFSTGSVAASNFVVESVLSFLLVFNIAVEINTVANLEAYDDALVVVYMLLFFSLFAVGWVSCVAAFLTSDATLSGALNPENLTHHRRRELPKTLQVIVSRPGRWIGSASSLVAVGLLLFAFSFSLFGSLLGETMTADLPSKEATIPAFTLTSLEGERIDSESYRGKPTVLYFWAPWCKPCAGQVVELHELMDTWGDQINVVSIAMSFDDRKQIERYVEKKGVRYQVLLEDRSFWPEHRVGSYPTVMLMDENGKVLSKGSGVQSASHLSTIIKHGKEPLGI